eukprot:366430-Chlamydomonas_euryale.AAC.10
MRGFSETATNVTIYGVCTAHHALLVSGVCTAHQALLVSGVCTAHQALLVSQAQAIRRHTVRNRKPHGTLKTITQHVNRDTLLGAWMQGHACWVRGLRGMPCWGCGFRELPRFWLEFRATSCWGRGFRGGQRLVLAYYVAKQPATLLVAHRQVSLYGWYVLLRGTVQYGTEYGQWGDTVGRDGHVFTSTQSTTQGGNEDLQPVAAMMPRSYVTHKLDGGEDMPPQPLKD